MRLPCAARAPARRTKRAPYGGGRCIYGRGRSLTVDVGIHLQQPQPLSHRGALAAVHITPGARVACTALTREVSFSFFFFWLLSLIRTLSRPAPRGAASVWLMLWLLWTEMLGCDSRPHATQAQKQHGTSYDCGESGLPVLVPTLHIGRQAKLKCVW